MRRLAAAFLLLGLLVPRHLDARPPRPDERELFKKGLAAYQGADYATAVAAWGELAAHGVTGEALDYNLGNASLKLGKLGPAILHYRRALRIDPGDDDAKANLEFARRRTLDARPHELPDPLPWLTAIRPGAAGAARLFLIFLNLGALAFAAVRFLRDPPAILRAIAPTAFSLAAFFALVLFWEVRSESHRREGVVMMSAVEARSGPGDDHTVAFQLHEGTEVSIGRESNGWSEISVTGELKGWVPPGAIEAIP